ncbi:hypothetical protein PG996_005254 [Apiospora saccharicola]|uniref:Transcription factor domain-containing protein n=1 Tax=Apiospora saccharicola TaxID=335842 RepID=A0ABR1VKZ3_9PEZI
MPFARLKRENIALKEQNKEQGKIIESFKNVSEQVAIENLNKFRLTGKASATPPPPVNTTISDSALLAQILPTPPAQGGIEFELMIRHSIAYPALIVLGIPGVDSASSHPPCSTPSQHRSLHIYWTRTAVTDQLAATLLSQYLQTDHPIVGLFDANLFVTDLVDCRKRFCSPLLVCALLCWACHAHTTIDRESASLAETFFSEAKALWEQNRTLDTLPTVAAAQLLSLVSIYNGNDGGLPYITEGIAMAKRMDLFRGSGYDAFTQESKKETDEIAMARAHTAWGVFNCVTMRSFLCQTDEFAIGIAPTVNIPGSNSCLRSAELFGVDSPSHVLPDYMGRTFPALCQFWALTSDWIAIYYREDPSPVCTRISVDFAEHTFQKLLAWSDSLHVMLARGPQSTHHAVILHIWYHVSILQIFRPFMRFPAQALGEATSTADYLSPEAKFTASLHQLKHLTVMFRSSYQCAGFTAFWHVALLYVGNAALEDSRDPQWRQYLDICVGGYADLYGAFRVAGGIAKSLLSLAVYRGLITMVEAQALLSSVHANGTHHISVEHITTTFVVDLNTAVSDRGAALLEQLADNFDGLAIFEEFTSAADFLET